MILCPYCDRRARLVTGAHIYRNRPDLAAQRYWRCDPCDAHVGCHQRGQRVQVGDRKVRSDGTLPLGRLANAELRAAKQRAHAAFDRLWRSGEIERREAYAWLAGVLGISGANCHIGLFDVDGCEAVIAAVSARAAGLTPRAAA